MSHQSHDSTRLHSFERNNYFYGKLLTVRDMATEQSYHSGIRRTLSRYVTGAGGVCGLDVERDVLTDEESGAEDLEITVTEGLALDRCGRLLVVEEDATETVAVPVEFEGEETDTVSVYVEYDECYTEPVPAAKAENACEDNCEDNRIVERGRVFVEPGPPDEYDKPVADIEFPSADDLGFVDDRAEQVRVRGELEADASTVDATRSSDDDEPRTFPLDLLLVEGGPRETMYVDLHLGTNGVTGTLLFPPDTLLGEEGPTVPTGTFDVEGSFTVSHPMIGDLTVDLFGDATMSEDDRAYTFSIRLDDDPNLPGEPTIDLTLDPTDGGFSIDGTVVLGTGEGDTPPIEFDASGGLDVSETDDDRLIRGQMSFAGETAEIEMDSPAEMAAMLAASLEVSTTEWETGEGESVDGLLVEGPETESPAGSDVDVDHVLATMARSYYADERIPECPGTDDGPILIGTVTRSGETWSDGSGSATTTFERGPLVYTNDMLYDIIARHVHDDGNPHDVALEVGAGEAGPEGGPVGHDHHADATLGVEGPDGPTGTVELRSTDNSIDITPWGPTAVDLRVDTGLEEDYYVIEKSLQRTVESFSELAEDALLVRAPQLVTLLAFRISRTAMQLLDSPLLNNSPSLYLIGLRRPYEGAGSTASGKQITVNGLEDSGIVDMERTLLELLEPDEETEPNSPAQTPVAQYRRAMDHLDELLGAEDGLPTKHPFALARAQDRVAQAAENVLQSQPATPTGYEFDSSRETVTRNRTELEAVRGHHVARIDSGVETYATQQTTRSRLGRGVVPDVTKRSLMEAIAILDMIEGWTYVVESVSVDTPDEQPNRFLGNVTGQTPSPQTVGHKAAGIKLSVVEPQSPERIDGIGPKTASQLSRGGIETLSELALASPDTIRVLTGRGLETAAQWRSTARSYATSYRTTAVENVTREDAEAFGEVMMRSDRVIESPSDLALSDEEFQSMLEDLSAIEELEDAVSRIENLDWATIRNNAEGFLNG